MKKTNMALLSGLAVLTVVAGFQVRGQDAGPATGKDQITEVGDVPDFSATLAVAPGGKLKVNVDRGDVHITGADQSTIEIQIHRKVSHASESEAAEILKDERVQIQQSGNEISITARELSSLKHFFSWFEPQVEVQYKITVPRRFETAVETAGGEVQFVNLQGQVKARTEGGGLEFTDIDGDVDGQTEGGEVRANGCKNDLLLKTEGGGVTIEKFTGSRVRASTEGGSISANFVSGPKSDCELRTEGGDVTASIPGAAAVTLDAHTEGGSVTSELSVQVEGRLSGDTIRGTINGGGPLLKLETEGGNIKVLKL